MKLNTLTEFFEGMHDDGGFFKPTSERLANELYKEMLPIVAALASNPTVINVEKWQSNDSSWDWDEQAFRLVQMAHEIAIHAKTMHLSLLEEARERKEERLKEPTKMDMIID